MNDIVKEYLDIALQGADFNDESLARLRELMTDDDLDRICSTLNTEGEAQLKEASALRRYGRAKWGNNFERKL